MGFNVFNNSNPFLGPGLGIRFRTIFPFPLSYLRTLRRISYGSASGLVPAAVGLLKNWKELSTFLTKGDLYPDLKLTLKPYLIGVVGGEPYPVLPGVDSFSGGSKSILIRSIERVLVF